MCLSIEPSGDRSTLCVEVGSDFRLQDAQELGAAIAGADPGTEVEVDFRRVRDCEAPALARLAEAMRSGRAHVALRGVSDFHLKLLGYRGAPTDPRRRAAGALR